MTITAAEIRAIRTDLGLSQAQFAARLNAINPNLKVNRQTVYRWEGGSPAQAPNAHAEDAIRQAAPTGKQHLGVDRHQLADLIREHGVNTVGTWIDDFAHQALVSIREGLNFLGWEVMSAPSGVAIVFARREQRPQALDPEVITLQAERDQLEEHARRRYTDHPDIRGSREREDATNVARRRIGEINRRLLEIDSGTIRQHIGMLERAERDGVDVADDLALYRSRYETLKPAINPPVEGVLWINDEPANAAKWEHFADEAGYAVDLLFRSPADKLQ